MSKSTAKVARFYLDEALLIAAKQRQHNFIRIFSETLINCGFRVEYKPNSLTEIIKAKTRNGYSIVHMQDPIGQNGITFRRVYQYPFWQIENKSKRWDWQVAKDRFDPNRIDPKAAEKFYRAWQRRLFKGAAEHDQSGDYVYVPLQGRLLTKRSFQTVSPIEMVQTVLQTASDKRVVATFHPNETYFPDEEEALQNLSEKHQNLTMQTGNMIQHLQNCDYIVTENSAVAFNAMFFGKPSILFAKVDFHHICLNVEDCDVDDIFERVKTHTPDYARYIYWLWQIKSINAGRADAPQKTKTTLKRLGWPV